MILIVLGLKLDIGSLTLTLDQYKRFTVAAADRKIVYIFIAIVCKFATY